MPAFEDYFDRGERVKANAKARLQAEVGTHSQEEIAANMYSSGKVDRVRTPII